MAARWFPVTTLVLAQIGYPLTFGDGRTVLVAVTVMLGFTVCAGHALATRGGRVGLALVGVTTLGGLGIEAVGVATGFPFGDYEYGALLGPKLLGVPVLIPLAWTWMAWPAWLAAGQLVRRGPARVAVAGVGLAAWDLFLDPQMVADGYWRWSNPEPSLPGVAAVPVSNHLAWFGVGVVMMAGLLIAGGPAALSRHGSVDSPMLGLYLWTYLSSVLAHALLLNLPGSAVWGSLGMGLIALPLAVSWLRTTPALWQWPPGRGPYDAARHADKATP